MRLDRHTEMYQWEEKSTSQTEKSVGGSSTTTTTYTYDRTWSALPIDSSHFHVPANHENPPMNLRDETSNAADAAIGPRKLDRAVLDKLARFTPIDAPAAPAPAGWTASGSGYAHGDPASPAIGDQRVSFSAIASGPVSIVAGQRGDRLVGFTTPAGPAIALAVPGEEPAATMFGEARSAARGLAWGLRGGGFLLILIGLFLITRPLAVLVSVLPFLESIVDVGAFVVVFGLAVLVTLATVAIAHMYLQPLLSGGLVLAGIVVFALCAKLRGRRTAPAR
jgi:hypothetical protein